MPRSRSTDRGAVPGRGFVVTRGFGRNGHNRIALARVTGAPIVAAGGGVVDQVG